jgi:hypothetical protein
MKKYLGEIICGGYIIGLLIVFFVLSGCDGSQLPM